MLSKKQKDLWTKTLEDLGTEITEEFCKSIVSPIEEPACQQTDDLSTLRGFISKAQSVVNNLKTEE